jgi:adenine-specific DNA methylase
LTLEHTFDTTFTAALALREKQIQQNYRPVIGVHKWFARRPGTVFRNLMLAEFITSEPTRTSYWHGHRIRGAIADPFMGGGTPIYEANRLGLNVVGADINPMAYWIVRQSLAPLDISAFRAAASELISDVRSEISQLYQTQCVSCGKAAEVKYFLWVKTQACPQCGSTNDLFPGYLLAEAVRHPKHVVACSGCGMLNEYDYPPTCEAPAPCAGCGGPVHVEGPARRKKISCRNCSADFRYPSENPASAPAHRMWAIEYHCTSCKPTHKGRFFKKPAELDFLAYERSTSWLERARGELPIPGDDIPRGDETDRLHRWGYRKFAEMFNDRQLLGLGLLLRRIQRVAEVEIRHALLTVFSDVLRYQNMLCRYDTYALKCQDIFSVHGFPVGLIQCENNLLGIPRVGSGAFSHFVEKYVRAKQYCEAPFETRQTGKTKIQVPIAGEMIRGDLVDRFPSGGREAFLVAAPITSVPLPPNSLDGVFTDPPYYDNVQYAELMDFCFAWLRIGLNGENQPFRASTTRQMDELTGNQTMGRDQEHFAGGLSKIFQHCANALKPGAPFVFTYHHNDPKAYAPLVVAILDANLNCTATLAAPAEMGASLHISGTGSSVLDSIFVCRKSSVPIDIRSVEAALFDDVRDLRLAGLKVSDGDVRCLTSGHVARIAINRLWLTWSMDATLSERMNAARRVLEEVEAEIQRSEISKKIRATARNEWPEEQIEAPF